MQDPQNMMQQLHYQWNNQQLATGEVILKYMLICLYEQEQFHSLQYRIKKSVDHKKFSLIDIIQNFDQLNSREFFNHYCIRKIKAKAQSALHAILQGQFKVIVTDKIFSPLELLQVQANGQRVVCLHFGHNKRQAQILTKKDGLHFAVHDLEHAWEFYHDQTLYQIQIGTFQMLLQLELKDFFEDIKKHVQFKERYHYLISDMNTHWGHTLMYMHAMLVDFCSEQESSIEVFYKNFDQLLELSLREQQAFQKFFTKVSVEQDHHIINQCVLGFCSRVNQAGNFSPLSI